MVEGYCYCTKLKIIDMRTSLMKHRVSGIPTESYKLSRPWGPLHYPSPESL